MFTRVRHRLSGQSNLVAEVDACAVVLTVGESTIATRWSGQPNNRVGSIEAIVHADKPLPVWRDVERRDDVYLGAPAHEELAGEYVPAPQRLRLILLPGKGTETFKVLGVGLEERSVICDTSGDELTRHAALRDWRTPDRQRSHLATRGVAADAPTCLHPVMTNTEWRCTGTNARPRPPRVSGAATTEQVGVGELGERRELVKQHKVELSSVVGTGVFVLFTKAEVKDASIGKHQIMPRCCVVCHSSRNLLLDGDDVCLLKLTERLTK